VKIHFISDDQTSSQGFKLKYTRAVVREYLQFLIVIVISDNACVNKKINRLFMYLVSLSTKLI